MKRIPKHWPVFFQSFRIFVELLIWGVFLRGGVGVEATFEGYNYEIYVGVSALLVGYLVMKNKISKAVLKAWNIIGLCFLAFIVMIFNTLFLMPELWGYSGYAIPLWFLDVPYMLIAAVFMPMAVFMHIFSLKQLSLGGE